MNSKKLLQMAAILIAGIWISTIGTVIVVKNVKPRYTHTTQPPIIITTAPSFATQPTSAAPVNGNDFITSPTVPSQQIPSSQAPSVAPTLPTQPSAFQSSASPTVTVPQGKSAIIAAYVNGINQLKGATNFSLVEDSALTIAIDHVTGGSVVQGLAEKFVTDNQATEPINYNFVSGVDASTGLTPLGAIPPKNQYAALNEDFVTSATATANADGGYTVTLKLKTESQTQSAAASNHAGIVNVIDMSELMISGASVEAYEIVYSDTTITAVFNKENRIVSFKHYMNVPSSSGNGKYTIIPVEMAMHGEYTGTFNVTY